MRTELAAAETFGSLTHGSDPARLILATLDLPDSVRGSLDESSSAAACMVCRHPCEVVVAAGDSDWPALRDWFSGASRLIDLPNVVITVGKYQLVGGIPFGDDYQALLSGRRRIIGADCVIDIGMILPRDMNALRFAYSDGALRSIKRHSNAPRLDRATQAYAAVVVDELDAIALMLGDRLSDLRSSSFDQQDILTLGLASGLCSGISLESSLYRLRLVMAHLVAVRRGVRAGRFKLRQADTEEDS